MADFKSFDERMKAFQEHRVAVVDVEVNDKELHSAEERMENLDKTAKSVSQSINESADGFMRIGSTMRAVTSEYANLIKRGQEYQEDLEWIRSQYEQIKQQQHEMAEGGITTRNLKEFEALGEELRKLANEYQAVQNKTEKLNDTMAKMEEAGFGSAYKRSFSEVEGYIKAIEEEIKERKLNLVNSDNIDEDIAKIKGLENELKKLNQIQTQVQDQQGGQSGTSAWAQDLHNIFIGLGSTLKTVVGGAIKGTAVAFSKVAQGIGTGIVKVHEFGLAIEKISFQAIVTGAKAFVNAIGSMVSGLISAGSALARFTAGGINLLAQGTKTCAQGLVKLGSSGFNLVKAGAERAGNAVKGLLAHFKSLGGDASKKLMRSFTSIKSMLMRRVKRTFIGAIFNQAKEGLHSLAKQSKEFNEAMSNIKNSAKGASGNLAVFFGNLITTIEPILTRIINLISKVISYINALFAILSGSKTMTVAKKSTDDYAKSLNKAGGSAENAMGKFDELNVIGKDSGGGNAGQIEYEQKEIADILPVEIQKMYDDLFDAINKQQWEEAGRVVGNFANTIIDTLDKKVVEWRAVTTKYAKIAGEFLNGLIDALDFEKVGNLIGHGVNLITDTMNTFLTTFDFKKFGGKIADKWNGIFDAVDFSLLGKTVANVLNSIWNTIDGFVSKLNFGQIGSKVAEGISSWAKTINFETVAHAITTGINGLSDLIHNLVFGIDLGGAVESFGQSITSIFTGIHWSELGVNIGSGISSIFEIINTLLSNIDFGALGTGLANGLFGLIDGIDWENLGTLFATYYNSIFDIIKNFVDTIDFEAIARKLVNGINGFITNINWETLASSITTGVNKLILAFKTIITGVDWVQLTKDLATNLNNIVSDVNWTDLGDMLSNFVNTTFDVINTFLTTFDFNNLGEQLGEGFKTIINTVEWGDIGETVSGFINATFSAISGFVSQIDWDGIGQALNDLIAGFNNSVEWDVIQSAITESINGLITAFHTIVTSDTMTNLASNLGKTIGGILSEINWEGLATDIGLGIGKLVEAFGKFLTELNLPNIATQLAEGINAFFDPSKGGANWNDALTAVTEGANSIIEAFAGLVDGINFGQISESLASSINTLIQETDWATLITTVGNLVVDLNDAFWGMVADIDFVSLGQQLVDGINGFFSDESGNLDSTKFESLGAHFGEAIKGILEGIDKFIQDIDLDKIVQAIGTYISAIDWTEIAVKAITGVGDAIGKAVSALPTMLKGIIEFIKGIDWLEVAKAILSALANVLMSAVESVGGIISTIWKAIFGGGEDVEVPQVFSDKVQRELKEQAGEQGKSMANSMETSLVDNLQNAGSDYESAKRFFLNSASLIGTGFQDTFENTMQNWNIDDATTASMAVQANAVFEACRADDATVDKIKETFRASGVTITDGLAEALKGQGAENVATALALLAQGVDQETLAMIDMTNLNENLRSYMESTGATLEDVAKELGAGVGEGIGTQIPDAIKEALKVGSKEVEATAEEIAQLADTSKQQAQAGENATETGEIITGDLSTSVENGTGEVENATDGVVKTVNDRLDDLPEDVKPYAENMMQYIIDGIESGDPLVQQVIETSANAVVEKVKEILASTVGYDIAKEFVEGISNGADETFKSYHYDEVASGFTMSLSESLGKQNTTLLQKIGEVVWEILDKFSESLNKDKGATYGQDIIAGISNGIASEYRDNLSYEISDVCALVLYAFDDYINSSNGYDIAYHIMQGLVNGLSQNKGAVISIAQTIAHNLVTTMKRELKIKSPSRVFAEIGDYTMQGLRTGLEGRENDVLSTVGDIASAISEEGKNADFEASFGNMNSELDGTVNKLAQIASIFNDIAKSIADMGGLAIPSVAKGQVVPYKTKVSDIEQISEMLGALPNINGNEELVPLLVEQNNLLRELLAKPFSVALNPSASLGRTVRQSEQMYLKQAGG